MYVIVAFSTSNYPPSFCNKIEKCAPHPRFFSILRDWIKTLVLEAKKYIIHFQLYLFRKFLCHFSKEAIYSGLQVNHDKNIKQPEHKKH